MLQRTKQCRCLTQAMQTRWGCHHQPQRRDRKHPIRDSDSSKLLSFVERDPGFHSVKLSEIFPCSGPERRRRVRWRRWVLASLKGESKADIVVPVWYVQRRSLYSFQAPEQECSTAASTET